MKLKEFIKTILITARIPLTKNLKYDILTFKVLDKTLKLNSNCIDIGGLKGEIMQYMLKRAGGGEHLVFEPITKYANLIRNKFTGSNVAVHQMALSDETGEIEFNYVTNAPSYSGLKRREYPTDHPEIKKIKVKVDKLDNVIGSEFRVDLIKIDVEGAEQKVLLGAKKTILRSKPLIIFEFGLGASEYYGSTPEAIFDYFDNELEYSINLLDKYLKNKLPLSREAFINQYKHRINYYFIAYAK